MAKIKLVGLVRVSGAGQAARDTPAMQREVIRRIADQHGADLVDVVEVVVTVSDLTLTPEWRTRVAPHIRDPQTHIAVYHQDRLARPLDWSKDYLALAALQQTATNIYSPSGIRDLSTEEGRMLVTMEALIAGGERARIIKRTGDGKKKWATLGRCVQGRQSLPAGIANDKETHAWGYTDDIEKVKRAFKMLLDGESYKDIARAVQAGSTPVRGWFENDLYRGLYRSAWAPDGSPPVRVYGGEGQPPQAIDDRTWQAAQVAVHARATTHSKPQHSSELHTLFSGILLSAYAGAAPKNGFVFDLSEPAAADRHVVYGHLIYGRGKQTAYVCRCIHQGWPQKCGLRTWQPVERLHGALDAFLAHATGEDWFVTHLQALLPRDEADDIVAQQADIERQIKRVERKADTLYSDRLNGDITVEVYKAFKAKLELEAVALRARLGELRGRPVITPDTLRAAARQLAYSPTWPIEQKRDWLVRNQVTIRIDNHGIDNVSLRLPCREVEDEVVSVTDGGIETSPTTSTVPVVVCLGGATWQDIVGYDIGDYWATLAATEGVWQTARAAELLGVPYEILRHLVRSGRLPLPCRKMGRVFLWTAAEIEAARATLAIVAHEELRATENG